MEKSYNNKHFIRNTIVTSIAVICLLIIIFSLYKKYSVITVDYTGFAVGENIESYDLKREITVSNELLNSDKIEFVQRTITGGGVNPGWVISLLETQPNIFTGRVIVDDGVYQHPVTLKEEVANVFVGEMKSKDGTKDVFTMRKTEKECKDDEGNIFLYTLTGVYGATQFLGCGGDILKEAK